MGAIGAFDLSATRLNAPRIGLGSDRSTDAHKRPDRLRQTVGAADHHLFSTYRALRPRSDNKIHRMFSTAS